MMQPIGDMLRRDSQSRPILHKSYVVEIEHLRASDAQVNPPHHVAQDTLQIVIQLLLNFGRTPLTSIDHGQSEVLGVAMIVGRLATGYLLDSVHASKVLMGFILASSTGVMLYAMGITPRDAPIAAVLVGLAIGAEFDGLSYVIPRYFEQSAFGKIYGTVFAIFQLGSGAGIVAIGFSHDRLGSFRPSMWTLSVVMVLAGLLAGRLGPYAYGSMTRSSGRAIGVEGEVPDALK